MRRCAGGNDARCRKERLQITGIEPGRYNVKLADKIGRNCVVTNIEEGGCGLLNRGTTEGLRLVMPLCCAEKALLAAGQRTGRALRLRMNSQVVNTANCGQAASLPDAFATWVAIASIKAGDRQS